jgi:hypothetical protein
VRHQRGNAGAADALDLHLVGLAARVLHPTLPPLNPRSEEADRRLPSTATASPGSISRCNLVAAGDTAEFGPPVVVVPSLAGGRAVPNLIGAIPRAVAVRMLLTGNGIDAAPPRDGARQRRPPATTLPRRPAPSPNHRERLVRDAAREDARRDRWPAAGQAFRMTSAWGLLRDPADPTEGRATFAETRRRSFAAPEGLACVCPSN